MALKPTTLLPLALLAACAPTASHRSTSVKAPVATTAPAASAPAAATATPPDYRGVSWSWWVSSARSRAMLAAFSGSAANIARLRALLTHQDQLTPLQAKQLETALYNAANSPQTAAELVKRRIKAEAAQTEKLYGFDYKYAGKSVTTNDLDELLRTETNPQRRQQVWEASKAIGPTLKPGLLSLRDLRNQTVQALGYADFFSYQASDYGLTRAEMMALVRQLNQELRPLYRELHTYARYELAKKYGVRQVPAYLPASWLPNRWGQDWGSLVTVRGINLDAALAPKGPEYPVRQAERFYQSL
ncbi:MAG: peptidase, partial [Hymenobacter sp.]